MAAHLAQPLRTAKDVAMDGCKLLILCTLLVVVLSGSMPSYNEMSARRMATFAAAAYCEKPDHPSLLNWNCTACAWNPSFKIFSLFDVPSSNTFGYSGYYDKYNAIILSFRGTQGKSIKNWITDIDIIEIAPYSAFPSVKVCRGFYHAWDSVKQNVSRDITALFSQHPNAELWVTGHSLGAALSSFAAHHFSSIVGLGNIVSHHTFGSPRVGNVDFYSMMQKEVTNSWRLTHYRDIVPHVPTVLQGYHHVPTEIFYNEAFTNYTICDGSGEDPKCSDQYDIDLSVADHLHYFNFDISQSCWNTTR